MKMKATNANPNCGGDTSLVSGKRVSKGDLQVETYGTIDELNALIGLAVAQLDSDQLSQELVYLQRRLFAVGALLACEDGKIPSSVPRITKKDIEQLTEWIDQKKAKLPKLTSFIIPGGTIGSATLHVARTVCRRAERVISRYHASGGFVDEELVQFINLLSDYLFAAARSGNYSEETGSLTEETV